MATAQDIIDRARVVAQDDGTRYKDEQALAQLNDCLKSAKRLRPDLWFGKYGTPLVDLALGGTIPLPPEFEPALVKALVFWFDLQEDEYSNDSRAAACLTLFEKELLG